MFFVCNVVSIIASVVTLILFIMYIAGRVWTIHKETCYSTESFALYPQNSEIEHENDIDFGGSAVVEIISSMAYKTFTVTSIEYDVDKEVILKRGKSISLNNIQVNKPIYIIVDLPELVPFHIVEFRRDDGVEGSFMIMTGGRTGEIIPYKYELHHTKESKLYYLVR